MYDICIIGGGINGTAIARDAAGRGKRVLLLEKGDLAGATSSNSSKLIHGGLRYLEHYNFNLVRHALQEREILWRSAPHIIWPLRFILPHHDKLRPKWLLRAGLWLYDHLDFRQTLPKAKRVKLETGILKNHFKTGFEYSDLWVDDSRLTLLNALDAHERGAAILPRTALLKAIHEDNLWVIHHEKGEIKAKLLINAAGPWVSEVNALCGLTPHARVRHVKGSHLIVPKLYAGDKAYTLQNADGRVLFALPYETDFTLLGTTDEDYHGSLDTPKISAAEEEYLLADANIYFQKQLTHQDIIASYSGIRPLYADGASKAKDATRDYVIERHKNAACIYGGKITTARRLAEEVLDEPSHNWTAFAKLPGGDFTPSQIDELTQEFQAASPQLTPEMAARYLRHYGTRARQFLQAEMGEDFGAGLFAAEVDYLVTHEWAQTVEDILKRRTKLYLKAVNSLALAHYLTANQSFTPN